MGYVGSKPRSPGLVYPLETTDLLKSLGNFTRMFVLKTSQSSLNMGHVGSKTRSLSQSALKPCSPFRGHSFASIFTKLNQNDSLDETSVKFEYGSCQIKN